MSINFHIYCTFTLPKEDAIALLHRYAQENGYRLLPSTKTKLEHDTITIASTQTHYTSILTNPTLAYKLEEFLLQAIDTPILAFAVYQDDFWLYELSGPSHIIRRGAWLRNPRPNRLSAV
jgi:hypothetical protein